MCVHFSIDLLNNKIQWQISNNWYKSSDECKKHCKISVILKCDMKISDFYSWLEARLSYLGFLPKVKIEAYDKFQLEVSKNQDVTFFFQVHRIPCLDPHL